jgi:stress response protein SCP2
MSNKTFTPKNIALAVSEFTLAVEIFAKQQSGAPVDPYLLAILLDKDNQASDLIFWNNPESSGLRQLENDLEHTNGGEEISVDIAEIPPEVLRIIFLFTTESSLSPGHTLSSLLCLSPLYCSGNIDEEIGIYREPELGESASLQVAEMVRQADESWQLTFQPVPLEGSLSEVLAQFGITDSD